MEKKKGADIRHHLGGFYRFPDPQNGYYSPQHILSGKEVDKDSRRK